MEGDSELRGSHLQSSNMMQSLSWASRILRMYRFEHIWVYITRIHLLLLNQRTSSMHQDSSPQMSAQCLGAVQLALLNQNMPLSGTTVALGPASYCFIGIAVGCFTTLDLWLYLVLIQLPSFIPQFIEFEQLLQDSLSLFLLSSILAYSSVFLSIEKRRSIFLLLKQVNFPN